jgi:hypothetical protein
LSATTAGDAVTELTAAELTAAVLSAAELSVAVLSVAEPSVAGAAVLTTLWPAISWPAGMLAEPVRTSAGAPMGGGARLGFGARWPRPLASAGAALVADAGT